MNRCETRAEDGFQVVAVYGEVDLSWSAQVREAILAALKEGTGVLVELDRVSYMDSSGIAALVEGYQTARSNGTRFGLIRVSQAVRSVLELARLDQVFPIFADLDAARA